MKSCTYCSSKGLRCRAHPRSGRCNNCTRKNRLDCDIAVTSSEFKRMRALKEKLSKQLEESRTSLSLKSKMADDAVEAAKVAAAAASSAASVLQEEMAREGRLRKQMESLDAQADEAIALLDAQLNAGEEGFPFAEGPTGGEALLAPEFWETTLDPEWWIPPGEPAAGPVAG